MGRCEKYLHCREQCILNFDQIEDIVLEDEVVPTNITKPSSARKNVRRYSKKRGAKILDVPDSNFMFVLAHLKGRTQPVLAFLDSGCSDAVFEHGIPGSQLPGFRINQGPISCTGVGNIQLKAQQEWRAQL